jgi:hypothetical protein
MPPRPTPRRKSVRPSPKSDHIDDETWASVLNQELVIDTAKKTYVGTLVNFTKGHLELSPKTFIARSKIIAFCEAKHAPPKDVTRPPVR